MNRKLQLDFLISQGLLRKHKLLDFGCGQANAAIFFIDYLDIGNYYGCDHKDYIIRAAKKVIHKRNLNDKIPTFEVVQDFILPFQIKFDFIWLCSVFTHLSLNRSRECICKLLPFLNKNGQFLATIKTSKQYCVNHNPLQDRYEILNIEYPIEYFENVVGNIVNIELLSSQETSKFSQSVVQIYEK